ncbi:hypothetical protein GCM10023170_090600 [Phytohabitans houttuyneae]
MNRHPVTELVTPRVDTIHHCGRCGAQAVWDELHGWIKTYRDDTAQPAAGPGPVGDGGLCCSRPPSNTTPRAVRRAALTPRADLADVGARWMAAASPMPPPSTPGTAGGR